MGSSSIKSVESLKSVYKISSSSVCGNATSYAEISDVVKKKLSASKQITYMAIYKSPLKDSPKLPEHHEVIIELDNMVWLLISWCFEGLDTKLGMEQKQVASYRPNNKLLMSCDMPHPTSRLTEFIKKHQTKKYDLLYWNCRHYSITLWREFNIDIRNFKIRFGEKKIQLLPGQSPQTWYGMPA